MRLNSVNGCSVLVRPKGRRGETERKFEEAKKSHHPDDNVVNDGSKTGEETERGETERDGGKWHYSP